MSLPKGGIMKDITDWLDNGGTKENLLQLAAQAPTFSPDAAPPIKGEEREHRRFLTVADLLEQKPRSWLVTSIIPERSLAGC